MKLGFKCGKIYSVSILFGNAQQHLRFSIPAPAVRAVDTTGAGDCLNGVLCALLLEGMPLAEAAETAVRAASLSVTFPHVLDGMPYREELEADGKE